jgi:hypothetical protein
MIISWQVRIRIKTTSGEPGVWGALLTRRDVRFFEGSKDKREDMG